MNEHIEFTDLPVADQTAIVSTMIALREGFAERNADKLRTVYSDDADWVNAFGTVKRGALEIVEYLRGLLQDENFDAGTVVMGPDVTFRVVTPDVVAVSAHLVIEGQKLVGGGSMCRDNYSLRILQRYQDGRWPIISEMFNDANVERTYVGHEERTPTTG